MPNPDFPFDSRFAFCSHPNSRANMRNERGLFFCALSPRVVHLCLLSKWRDELSHLAVFWRQRGRREGRGERTPTFRHSISPTRKTDGGDATLPSPSERQYEMGKQLAPSSSPSFSGLKSHVAKTRAVLLLPWDRRGDAMEVADMKCNVCSLLFDVCIAQWRCHTIGRTPTATRLPL